MSDCLTTDYTQSTQLTELELKVLQQYQSLAKRLNQLAKSIDTLVTQPTPQLLESLRVIESKIALVFTLFKAAVYSLFLQQEGTQQEDNQDTNQFSNQPQSIDTLQESTQQSFI